MKVGFQRENGRFLIRSDASENSGETIYLRVFEKPDLKFVASCSFRNIEHAPVEIGIDVVREKRAGEIGNDLLHDLIAWGHEAFPERELRLKSRADDPACRRIAEKNGGIIIGREPTPMANALMRVIAKIGEEEIPLPEELKKMNAEAIERGREGICVYCFP